MHHVALLWVGLFVGDLHDYSRPLDAKELDQATLDAESYGEKKKIKREDEGLRITLSPGEAETGWKTPQAVRFGGDFTVTAAFVIRKLPKPAREDGAAVGMAIATQNLDQPDATLVRLIELNGSDVYRSIEKPGNAHQAGMPPGMMVQQPPGMPMPPGGKPVKPPRKTFRAKGERIVLELRREGPTVGYYVLDGESDAPRYLGQVSLGASDVAGVKLFVTNRNGAEAVDVVLRSLTIRADRINGLGTEVRTVFGEIVHGEPIAIEAGKLLIGAPSPASSPFPSDSGPRIGMTGPNVRRSGPTPMPNPATVKSEKAPAALQPGGAEVKAGGPATAKGAAAPKPTPPPKAVPKARIPLDEMEVIAFERAVTLSGRYVGQPNVDFTMPGGGPKTHIKADDALAPPPGTAAAEKIPKIEPGPSGICDLHLTLSSLRNAAIQQVSINAQTDKGAAAWRIDTSNSRDWPLVLRRAGTESWADLFLEPPPADLKGKDLTVNVTYADGQSANTTIKVEPSTDPKRVFDPKAPAPSLDARVHLTGGEQLFGKFEGLGAESLRLQTPWGDKLVVPLTHVVGIYMGLPEHKESSESFARRLRTRGTEDLLLARSSDGEVVAIPGVAEGTEGDKLLFHFQEKTRTISLKQVEGLVLAARPEPERPEGLRPTFSMAGGLVVSGLWKALDAKTWKVETAWGQELNLPAGEVLGVRFRGGRMTYLSDLEPSRVEEVPYFGRHSPWRKDVNLVGAPLKMDGRTYERGLAVHSRSALTYDLNGRYATFEALVGFDESARKMGRVDCRVFADDKELYANPDLRADAPPVKLVLPVAGAERLKLVVDFGPDQDTGDRVIWANARLFRKPAPAASGASADATRPPQTQTSKPGSGQ
jgi:hypothetical protein